MKIKLLKGTSKNPNFKLLFLGKSVFGEFFGACQENCVNGYVRISRLEPVCQIVWQIDLPLKPNF